MLTAATRLLIAVPTLAAVALLTSSVGGPLHASPLPPGEAVLASNFQSGFFSSGFRTDIGYMGSPRFTNTSVSQRFRPTSDGVVEGVDLVVEDNSALSPLIVTIRSDRAGEPAGVLGRVSLSSRSIPSRYVPPQNGDPLITVRADFASQGIVLVTGRQYHVLLETTTAKNSGPGNYSSHVMRPNADSFGLPYLHNDGSGTWRQGGFSLEVPIRVTTRIPEPATLCVTLPVLVMVGRRRR